MGDALASRWSAGRVGPRGQQPAATWATAAGESLGRKAQLPTGYRLLDRALTRSCLPWW
jgi:hypothetical protein